jgi:hypothetical protein
MVKGTAACQESGGQAQAFGVVHRGTRAIRRKLNCLNPNPQEIKDRIHRKSA